MIQQTLNSSDYHFQIPIFSAQSSGRWAIAFRLRALFGHWFRSTSQKRHIHLTHNFEKYSAPQPAKLSIPLKSRCLFVFCLLLLTAEPLTSGRVRCHAIAPCHCQWLWLAVANSPRNELQQFWPMYCLHCRTDTILLFNVFFFLSHSTSPRSGRMNGCEYATHVCLHSCGSSLISIQVND